ncbi:MAG: class I SAM-dependent methyltransferase [Bacillota bacterium]|nr:class I SAM-dependent methyltransferase [Bacillota bacterium]
MEREVYSIGYGPGAHRWHSQRTARDRAGFFLPFLRPGMRLLDCGCGPGSITLGFAEVLASGSVVGVDLEPRQIERARALAAQRGAANVEFRVGDIYELAFPDASFDAAFAHNVLEHLSDPLRALREMRRVLRPGGVVAIRDPDYGTVLCVPSTPLLAEASSLVLRVRERNGGSPYYARHQRRLLLEAGFGRSIGFAFAECQGDTGAVRAFADILVEVLCSPATVDVAVGEGWADRETLDAMAAGVRAWSEEPGAFRAVMDCAAVGWVDGPAGERTRPAKS